MSQKSSKYFFYVEVAAIVSFAVLAILLLIKILINFPLVWKEQGWLAALVTLIMLILGYVGADFTSGMVHFLCDNFGSAQTPFLGKNFILPFRLHHSDPEDITRHGFIETNGRNSLVNLPILLATLCFLDTSNLTGLALATLFLSLNLAVFATNQFHKWAHTRNLPSLPLFLQKYHLALSKTHHQIHHTAPHDKYYCITTGWLNPFLTKIKFFELILVTFKKKSSLK